MITQQACTTVAAHSVIAVADVRSRSTVTTHCSSACHTVHTRNNRCFNYIKPIGVVIYLTVHASAASRCAAPTTAAAGSCVLSACSNTQYITNNNNNTYKDGSQIDNRLPSHMPESTTCTLHSRMFVKFQPEVFAFHSDL
jgi:hypothetical protein